ncbi:Rossmann-like and DUF2520 domain-containing protein [Aquimarina sp. RZ0]|uniref:Rossmann-like and DUF2520 domain-containing protein n=1 Tax=Aquimarina sp. RZ0 TaxID=2607730 RepID=UPI0011F0E5A4|nr:DUF2520 domain-containing protein [Aquimarina sp. RZ0]KAA1246364.1 DUF2520 domain-containing protein [Aquimarina sp. RZ0]
MIRIVIIGAGNVARHLYTAFHTSGLVKIVQCYNRQGIIINNHQQTIPVTDNINNLAEADIYIIAISDDAIESVAKHMLFKDRLVVHTSGSVPMKILNDNNRKGVFYPLQTLSATKRIDYTTIPFCIEAEEKKDIVLLQKLATTLSPKVYEISSDQRKVLHVAAVFVNNFTNYMFSMGNEICSEHNIPFEILHPLISETAKKILEIPPQAAQTGPAKRNDQNTIHSHLDILKDDSKKELYKLLTKAIQLTYGKEL